MATPLTTIRTRRRSYLYYRQQQDVVKIDAPGFEGTITKGKGLDIEVGKDK